MIWSFCVLLLCQALGEVLHSVTGVPVPGTVIGIGLLLLGLGMWRRGSPRSLPAGDALLPYLGLFFVPPGVSALLRLTHLTHALLPVAAAILISSVVTLAIAGRVAQALLSFAKRRVVQADQPASSPQGQAS